MRAEFICDPVDSLLRTGKQSEEPDHILTTSRVDAACEMGFGAVVFKKLVPGCGFYDCLQQLCGLVNDLHYM